MNRRKALFWVSLTVFAFAGFCLFTGSSLLEIPLYPGSRIPLGTPITWAGFMALPLVMLTGFARLYTPANRPDRCFAGILRFLLFLAILWLPICYFLAGNASFSFAETDTFQGGQTAMQIFWAFNLALALAPVLFSIVYLGYRITRK